MAEPSSDVVIRAEAGAHAGADPNGEPDEWDGGRCGQQQAGDVGPRRPLNWLTIGSGWRLGCRAPAQQVQDSSRQQQPARWQQLQPCLRQHGRHTDGASSEANLGDRRSQRRYEGEAEQGDGHQNEVQNPPPGLEHVVVVEVVEWQERSQQVNQAEEEEAPQERAERGDSSSSSWSKCPSHDALQCLSPPVIEGGGREVLAWKVRAAGWLSTSASPV
jgi:hypothetical protein